MTEPKPLFAIRELRWWVATGLGEALRNLPLTYHLRPCRKGHILHACVTAVLLVCQMLHRSDCTSPVPQPCSQCSAICSTWLTWLTSGDLVNLWCCRLAGPVRAGGGGSGHPAEADGRAGGGGRARASPCCRCPSRTATLHEPALPAPHRPGAGADHSCRAVARMVLWGPVNPGEMAGLQLVTVLLSIYAEPSTESVLRSVLLCRVRSLPQPHYKNT